MSELCSIHGVPLSDWLSECPACKAEKKRHDEALEAQRAQQEAIEQQSEQLRQAAEAEAERAMEAQWALDDLAASTRARLEEDRLHRQAETERATLRAGVRELTPALQTKWQDASAKRAQLLEAAKAFDAAKTSLTAAINSSSAARVRELQKLVEREGDAVQRALSSHAPSFLGSLPENRLAPADKGQAIGDALRRASEAAKPFLSGRVVSAGGDPTLATSVWPVLRALEEAKESVRVPEKGKPPSVGCLGIVAAVIGFFVVGGTASFFGDIVFRKAHVLNSLFTLGGAATGIFLGIFLTMKHQEAREKPHRDFSEAFADLKRVLAETRVPDTSAALQRHLTQAYVLSSIDKLSDVEPYQAVTREVEKVARDLEALEQGWRNGAPERARCLKEYSFLRQEVMRVGSEIIEGTRAPGRLLQATNCTQCGGPTTSETRQCPYCRSGFVSPVEVER